MRSCPIILNTTNLKVLSDKWTFMASKIEKFKDSYLFSWKNSKWSQVIIILFKTWGTNKHCKIKHTLGKQIKTTQEKNQTKKSKEKNIQKFQCWFKNRKMSVGATLRLRDVVL
jgi:tRNA G10  N-methylase Trm11